LVVALGRLIIASGPAWCSPLNGVNPVKPQAAASAGLFEPEADVKGVGRRQRRRRAGVEPEDLIDYI
jgi:hypothetical protein